MRPFVACVPAHTLMVSVVHWQSHESTELPVFPSEFNCPRSEFAKWVCGGLAGLHETVLGTGRHRESCITESKHPLKSEMRASHLSWWNH